MSKYIFKKFKQTNHGSLFPNPFLPCALHQEDASLFSPFVTQNPVLLLVFVV